LNSNGEQVLLLLRNAQALADQDQLVLESNQMVV
jgi:urease accessory protein UreE